MDIDWNAVLTNLVFVMLIAAIPIVVGLVRSLVQQQLDRLELEIGERNYWLLQSFAHDVVAAAEQTLGDANIDKKAYAVKMLSEMVQSLGLEVTPEQIDALIEAAVHGLKTPTLDAVELPQLEMIIEDELAFDIGSIVHYVLPDGKSAGQVRPAVVVRIWDDTKTIGTSQLQVFTDDQNDGLPPVMWATSILYDENGAPGTWHFPGDLKE